MDLMKKKTFKSLAKPNEAKTTDRYVNTADPRIEVQSVPSGPTKPGAKPLNLAKGERGTSRG